MKCKREIKKKKKESPRTTNFLQSRKRFKKNHKNLDTILLRKRNLQSNFWNVFHPKKPFQLSESLFHRKHPWKISPRSPLSQNFHKTPCEEDFFHNRANKILLESLSLSFSLQIFTQIFFFTYPQRYNREGKDLRRDLPITEISFRWRETDYITTSRG